MDPATYFDSVEERLVADPLIAAVDFLDRWQTDVNGYFRARLSFVNGQRLEFAEYVQRVSSADIQVITHAFQWMAADHSLLCHWDNTPHFPQLAGFPCHRHDGREDQVFPDEPRTILTVLDEIVRRGQHE